MASGGDDEGGITLAYIKAVAVLGILGPGQGRDGENYQQKQS